MNTLLIRPWSQGFDWAYSHSVGLSCLASFMRTNGFTVEIYDPYFSRHTESDAKQHIAGRSFDIIGITSMTHEIPKVRKIIQWIREINPNTRIVLGGPHATALPERTLTDLPHLDFVIAGEGEIPLVQLLRSLQHPNLPLTGIPGLAFRKEGSVFFNPPNKVTVDLTQIPLPATDLYYESQGYHRRKEMLYTIHASRGCPYHCAYCSRVLGRNLRWRSPESILAEWDLAVNKYGFETINIIDSIFLYNNEVVNAVLDGVIERGLNTKAQFSASVHVNVVEKDLIVKAKQAGCNYIYAGIESGNNSILETIHRPYTIEHAHTVINSIKEVGIPVHCYYILGHPGETHSSVIDSITAAVRMNSDEIGLGIMVPYPGTEIYDLASRSEGDYILKEVDWDGYDRYGGTALELKSLKQWHLRFYQILGYILFYLLNFRLRDMFHYFRPRLSTVFGVVLPTMNNSKAAH